MLCCGASRVLIDRSRPMDVIDNFHKVRPKSGLVRLRINPTRYKKYVEGTMKISIRWAMVLGCLGLIWGMQILITSSSYVSSQRMLAGHACDVMQNIADLTMTQSKTISSWPSGRRF